jgi:hypothetical protein
MASVYTADAGARGAAARPVIADRPPRSRPIMRVMAGSGQPVASSGIRRCVKTADCDDEAGPLHITGVVMYGGPPIYALQREINSSRI